MRSYTGLQEILYVSTIAADAPVRVVAEIAARARISNQALDITGLLVFDGLHFCQQLEGGARKVMELMLRICEDPRHTHVSILHHGPLEKRRFRQFSLGFSPVDDVHLLARLQTLQGPDAVEAFVAMLSSLDLPA
ncbi:MAG: hypothetical protein JWR68_1709 [Polaromonas sp.]|nr:hypothetical protein [Polaromonas sp.]